MNTLMKNIKAVAFDAWGTLFDEGMDSLIVTSAKIVNEMDLTMNREYFLGLWKRFYYENLSTSYNIRETNIISLNKTFKTIGIKGDVEKYVNFLIDDRWANSIVYPEVLGVLQSIKLPKCIISNIDNDTLHKALDKNGLVFEYIMTSEKAKAYKPDSKIFLEALKLLRCNNNEILFIGDSQRDDIVGAKNVGIPTVWVNRRKEKLEEEIPKPDYEIEDLKSLIEILDDLQTLSV